MRTAALSRRALPRCRARRGGRPGGRSRGPGRPRRHAGRESQHRPAEPHRADRRAVERHHPRRGPARVRVPPDRRQQHRARRRGGHLGRGLERPGGDRGGRGRPGRRGDLRQQQRLVRLQHPRGAVRHPDLLRPGRAGRPGVGLPALGRREVLRGAGLLVGAGRPPGRDQGGRGGPDGLRGRAAGAPGGPALVPEAGRRLAPPGRRVPRRSTDAPLLEDGSYEDTAIGGRRPRLPGERRLGADARGGAGGTGPEPRPSSRRPSGAAPTCRSRCSTRCATTSPTTWTGRSPAAAPARSRCG